MNESTNYNAQIAREAADWIALIDERELSEAERVSLAAWLKLSSQHVKEFLLMQSIGTAVGSCHTKLPGNLTQIIEENVVYAEQFLAKTKKTEIENESFAEDKKFSFRFNRISAIRSTAAALFLVTGLGLFLSISFSNRNNSPKAELVKNVVTSVGESATITLPDGSKAILNTDTQMNYLISNNMRRVEIMEGEVFFEIAKNPKSPFIVKDKNSLMRVVGTSFNVYSSGVETIISVTEGIVLAKSIIDSLGQPISWMESDLEATIDEESSVELRLGTKAVVDRVSSDVTVTPIDINQVASWLRNELVFENTPIRQVIKEYNRYNLVKINIVGSDLSDLSEQRVSGVFDPKDLSSFVSYLQLTNNVEVTHQNSEIFIRGQSH